MQTTAGQYIVANSMMHKLDPRVKILSNILIIVFAFVTDSIILYAAVLSLLTFFYLQSKIGIVRYLKNIRTVLYLGIFLFIMNLIILPTEGVNIIGSWWVFDLTHNSWMLTIKNIIRILVMILATSILSSTTRPNAITRGLEDILTPLKFIGFPVHIIAMVMSIALRFIPTLLNEANRIIKAQASRGVDFASGTLIEKSKALITLIIPLFVSAFTKAEDLGNAMETRGYDPNAKRTRYRKYPITTPDVFMMLFIIAFATLTILLDYNVIQFFSWDSMSSVFG